ncbi:two-component system sensor histidine kinase RppB [Leptolyngbya sp. FACHB-261]|uniref:two-component system sensor histidine kinase RppB n=1 Tax=Leptolyngbya sp. FACHB-261 TaxID=2692806 RepID=UPI001685558A|nr:two-component system sensor histidine kinase RppB [Leptolyngbya sp. FACHB-261]MBD2100082.1 two-component sensor histidine kinase [Leptolyngbya sp. FACHB-261]
MNQNKLFVATRWRLAAWYAGVMGAILSLFSIGVYQALTQAQWQALDRELETVAGTLHDSLEPTLKRPGQLEPAALQLIPNLCWSETGCQANLGKERHVLGALQQGNYYVRLLNSSEQMVAFAGPQPEQWLTLPQKKPWQTLQDRKGERYHQVSLSLHTQTNLPWGHLEVGRSLEDFDDRLNSLRLILLLGLPATLFLIGAASWWLGGLAVRPVYQSYQQMRQFTADAAHELRTPLASAQATVETALRAKHLPEEKARPILQTIGSQHERLSQLVRDLLLLSRIDQQGQTMQRLPCCLNEIVSDLIEELAAIAIAAEVKLDTNASAQKPLYVRGNSEQLYRLVSNLISNAIKYTPAGGQVTVFLGYADHYAEVRVEDTGIGIPPENQSRIFDRFYRVDDSRSRSAGGFGLGLAIAHAIAQAHHGNIQVYSQFGQGSTFIIHIPSTNIKKLSSSIEEES